jgi:hypothetical protein
MRCDQVIRELAAPHGDWEAAALAEHLAGCPACAEWARRAALLERLWEATRPPEPSPEAWDSVWAKIAQSLPASEVTEIQSPASPLSSRNGSSSPSKIHAHPAPVRPAARSHTKWPAAFTLVALAQAAAIVVAVGLAWHNPTAQQNPQTAQFNHPTPAGVPAPVKMASVVKVEADIEEGHHVVIRAEGTRAQVVDVPPEEKSFSVMIGKPVVHRVPLEDPWYVMFNLAEDLDQQMIAAR